jgi:hypothetical protein
MGADEDQRSEASPYCFGLAKSTVTGFSPLVAGVLLLKMLSPPRVDDKCQIQLAGFIWAECLPYCPGPVVPARHAKKTQIWASSKI